MGARLPAPPAGGAEPPAVRCKPEQWYLARGMLATPQGVGAAAGECPAAPRADVLLSFLRQRERIEQRCVPLHRVGSELAASGADRAGACELLGWFETPGGATHFRVVPAETNDRAKLAKLSVVPVAERDPKCHPLANVPRWSVCKPPFTLERIVLPAALEGLRALLDGIEVQFVERAPRSVGEMAELARGAAIVLDPNWVTGLGLGLVDLERVAAAAWVLVDLQTLARLTSRAGSADAEVTTYKSANGLMSARVEYADVPVRGLALQDVVPYAVQDAGAAASQDARGPFCVRVLRADRAWRRFADEVGFATVLSAETPWERKHGDVLSAMRPIGGGELIATDLPWLVAGHHGPLVAPRIAEHLLRMHLAAPLPDHVQYWNRWNDESIIVRDIADLAGRYAPLQAVRWAGDDPVVAHVGLVLPGSHIAAQGDADAQRPRPGTRGWDTLMLRSGRIDSAGLHDGLPPEPMMILMKWLAREVREQTDWARRWLTGITVVWQFETAVGVRYAHNYDAAPAFAPERLRMVRLRIRRPGEPMPPTTTSARNAAEQVTFENDEGLFGDGALAFQEQLMAVLRRALAPSGTGRQ